MFPTIRAEIARRKWHQEDLAKAVGMSASGFSLRMSGVRDFKRKEMLTIREVLAPDMTLDELFATDADAEPGVTKR